MCIVTVEERAGRHGVSGTSGDVPARLEIVAEGRCGICRRDPLRAVPAPDVDALDVVLAEEQPVADLSPSSRVLPGDATAAAPTPSLLRPSTPTASKVVPHRSRSGRWLPFPDERVVVFENALQPNDSMNASAADRKILPMRLDDVPAGLIRP